MVMEFDVRSAMETTPQTGVSGGIKDKRQYFTQLKCTAFENGHARSVNRSAVKENEVMWEHNIINNVLQVIATSTSPILGK